MSRLSPAPPQHPSDAALDWVLRAAFAATGTASLPPEQAARVPALARRLDLAARIAARLGEPALTAALGAEAAAELARARTQTAARDLLLLDLAAEVGAHARAAGIRVAWLKFAGLAATGIEVVGRRGASDVDLLAPEEAAEPLARRLEEAGFTRSPLPQPEHQAATLFHPAKGAVEIHLRIPGVLLAGRDARFAELEAVQLLIPADAVAAASLAPTRELLAAHAVAHGLDQHGWTADYPHLRALADLQDLGLGSSARGPAAPDVSVQTIAPFLDPAQAARLAALADLLSALAAGRWPRRDRPEEAPQAELLDHFLALALEPDYAAALKLQAAWRGAGERDRFAGQLYRLRRLLFLTPAEVHAIYGPQGGRGRVFLRQLLRPFDLAARAWASLRARRRLGQR